MGGNILQYGGYRLDYEERGASPTLREFMLSMLALLPSRNYVVQVLRILCETEGIDIDTFRQTYRGIIDDYVENYYMS
jgi:hypothetical protein